MKEIRIYKSNDLTYGTCESCGETSNEISIDDGRCVDCIEEERFYNITMNSQDNNLKNLYYG